MTPPFSSSSLPAVVVRLWRAARLIGSARMVRASVGGALVGTVLLAGCSSDADKQAVPAAASTPTSPSTVDATVPIPTNSLSTAKPTDAAVPPETPEQATAPPPATAGPLSTRNLPAPGKLGAGWKTYADPGGAEQGFVGNKTWTRQRDAHQAAYEALPVGCAGQLPSGSLPVPQYALQAADRTPPALRRQHEGQGLLRRLPRTHDRVRRRWRPQRQAALVGGQRSSLSTPLRRC